MTRTAGFRLTVLAAATVIAVAACGSGESDPEISDDCSPDDFASGGVALRAECAYGAVEITVWDDADRVFVESEQWLHADGFLRSMGLVPDTFDTADEAIEAFQEDPDFWSNPDEELAREVGSLTTDQTWTVADFASEDDFGSIWTANGHTLHITHATTEVLSTAGGVWDADDGTLSFDHELQPNAKRVSVVMNFPGPVESANGEISGSTVTWEFADGEPVVIEAVYRP